MNRKRQSVKSPKKRHSEKDEKRGSSKTGAQKTSGVSHPRADSKRDSSDDEMPKSPPKDLQKLRRHTKTTPTRRKSAKRPSTRNSKGKSVPTLSTGSISATVSKRRKSKKRTQSVDNEWKSEVDGRPVIPKTSEVEKQRISKRLSLATPLPKCNIEMAKIPTTDQGFLISEATRGCYVCDSTARYYNKGFYCESCIDKFEAIVKKVSSSTCPNKGKCDSKQECDFCLAEVFYLYGVRASNVIGFQRLARGYSLVEEAPLYPPELEVEETTFCRFFKTSTNKILDWLWQQGDLLKLTPKDRKSLLEMNIGRARLLWLVIDLIPRHSVIKTDNSYLAITGFASETILKTIIDVNDIAKYFTSISFTPQHLYFVKLLSIFQIGKCVPCSFAKNLHSMCHCDEDKFERGTDIKIISENYRTVLRQMHVHEGDIQTICCFIDLMKCMNEVMSEEECIEKDQVCLNQWIAAHPEWEKYMTEMLPSPMETYLEDTQYLSYYLNGVVIESLNCSTDYLLLHFSFRDQNVLLNHNIISLLVVSVCWNLEPIFGDNDENITDSNVKIIWSELREIQSYLHNEISKYLNLPDCQIMSLTRYYSDQSHGLQDIDLKEFDLYSRKLIFENAEKNLKQKFSNEKEQEEHIKMLRICIYEIMERINNAAKTLESMQSSLPLFINIKSWIMEI